MRNKGQETGDMDKGCMVLDNLENPKRIFYDRRKTHKVFQETRHLIYGTLSCRPNPHSDLDDLIPEEPEEIDAK